jgi:hypothetical protein
MLLVFLQVQYWLLQIPVQQIYCCDFVAFSLVDKEIVVSVGKSTAYG